MKQNFLKLLVKNRRISAKERLAQRLGYMGTAFIMMGPYVISYGNMGSIDLCDRWYIVCSTGVVGKTMEFSCCKHKRYNRL